MEVNWTEPPPTTRNYGSRKKLIAALRKNPGQWALYKTKGYASYGFTLRALDPHLEITLRAAGKNDNGTPLYDIYVRWNNDESGEVNA